MSSIGKTTLLPLPAALFALGLTTSAFAQIEEITVTATKRETTIQDVPFSINAQTAEDILEVLCAGTLDVFSRLRVNRERHVLDRRLTLGGRYRNLFDLRECTGRQTQRKQRGRYWQQPDRCFPDTAHDLPPGVQKAMNLN